MSKEIITDRRRFDKYGNPIEANAEAEPAPEQNVDMETKSIEVVAIYNEIRKVEQAMEAVRKQLDGLEASYTKLVNSLPESVRNSIDSRLNFTSKSGSEIGFIHHTGDDSQHGPKLPSIGFQPSSRKKEDQ